MENSDAGGRGEGDMNNAISNANVQTTANSQMVESAVTSRKAVADYPSANANAPHYHAADSEDEDDDDEEDDYDEEDDSEDEGPPVVRIPQANANAPNVRGTGSVVYGGYSYSSRFARGPRYDLSGAPAGAGINYLFYSDKAPSQPDHVYIHEFHEQWWAHYRRLEYEHGFIQWLFPVFESSGVNWDAEALSKSEAKLMREDFTIATRVIRSYRLMLNFYGIRLLSEVTGEVARWPGIWRDRYDNLNWSGHNNLRITRILTSLGELGFQRYKKPLVDFLTREIVHNRQLPNCRSSLMGFWAKTLDYASPAYRAKTREDPEDREDSVFFRHMAENSAEYQRWVEEEARELAQREQGLEEEQRRDDEEEQRRKESGADGRASSSVYGGGYASRWQNRWRHEEEDEDEDEDDEEEEEEEDDSEGAGERAESAVSENEDEDKDEDDDDEKEKEDEPEADDDEDEEEGKGKENI